MIKSVSQNCIDCFDQGEGCRRPEDVKIYVKSTLWSEVSCRMAAGQGGFNKPFDWTTLICVLRNSVNGCKCESLAPYPSLP